MRVLFVPSIKKDIKAMYRDYLIISYIDIVLIDYILNEISQEIDNLELIYMPFQEEKEEYVRKIIEIFKENKNFKNDFFSINNLLQHSKTSNKVILITDILKLSIWFSIKTFNYSINFLPILEKANNNISNLVNIATNIYDLKDYFKKILKQENNLKIFSIFNQSLI